MARILHHTGTSVDGMLMHFKNKKITIMEDGDGNRISDKEARAFLAECKAKGWKKFPNGECEGFDHFDKGCPGHEIKEDV